MRNLALASAAGAVLLISANAFAGQEPYVAVVGDDTTIDTFYISKKLYQFTHPNTDSAYTDSTFLLEDFRASQPINKQEVCVSDHNPPPPEWITTNYNALVSHNNQGWYEWTIVLPKKLEGNINIVVQCGVLKPEAYPFLGQEAIDLCAGETGERIGQGFCTRAPDHPAQNPVLINLLPRITVRATPGPYATPGFDTGPAGPDNNSNGYPFDVGDDWYTLVGYRVPGPFTGSGGLSVLNGGTYSRMLLKACQSEVVLAKIPVTGYRAGANRPEWVLEAGDRINVRLDIPAFHTMDVYCHAHSVRVQGNGRPETLLP
jgi:hypothetical protein